MSMRNRLAAAPFEFYTLAHVTRSRGGTANTVGELLAGLRSSSDESIYHHTIASLYATSKSTMNDYALWATGLNRDDLAEELSMIDSREFETISDLRRSLVEIVSSYVERHPAAVSECARAAFQFCEGIDLPVPLDKPARTLEELRQRLAGMSEESFYLHFLASRARGEEHSSDFSLWVSRCLGLKKLAMKIDEIDMTEITLDDARQKILALIDAEGEPTDSFAR